MRGNRSCQICAGHGKIETRDLDRVRSHLIPCPQCTGHNAQYEDPREGMLRARSQDEYEFYRKRYEREDMLRYRPMAQLAHDPMMYDAYDVYKRYEETIIPKQPKQKETKGMNYSTAVMLFNDAIRAVKVIYEPECDDQIPQAGKEKGQKPVKNPQRYVFKTLDETIKKGDYVVVPTSTRHGYTVVLVDEADVEVDHESGVEVKWIISRVDLSNSKTIAAEELKWIDTMKKSEKRAKKETIKKNMMEFIKEEEVQALAITHMGAKPAA